MLRTKPTERTLSDHQVSTLTNALTIASETFDGYVKDNATARAKYEAMSDADKDKHDAGMIHGRAYRILVDQFEGQAKAARDLIDLLTNGDDGEDGNADVEIIVRTTPERW